MTSLPGPAPVRVLAFTASRHRAVMLRHCIMQMQRQTHPVDHAIFVNSSEADGSDHSSVRYDALLEDASAGTGGRVFLGYGKSGTYHQNAKAALALARLDDYDLFLKIDDDDIYYRTYAEDVVADFVANRWDYSGGHSTGLLNGRRWFPDAVQTDLGLTPEDLELNVPRVMPPTLAMSRRAMEPILASEDIAMYDDIQWRRAVASRPDLSMAQRRDRNFVYNIHGGNDSTATWLLP